MKPTLTRWTCAWLAATLMTACDVHPASWKTANMTPLSPRLQTALKNLKPHCFGRFLIDLPEGTTVAWGGALSMEVAPGRAAELEATVKATEDRLKKEPRYPLTKGLHLYFETRDGTLPGMKHVISQQDFGSDGFLRINTYFAMGASLVAMQSYALTKKLDETLFELHDIARRLRPRTEEEIPSEPGQCIENAFLVDRPDEDKQEVRDFLNVGFRLKDPADVHLSISIEAATDNELGKPGLEKRLKDTEQREGARGNSNPYRHLTTFRRAKREIHDWKDGFEFLTRAPDDGESQSHHDFWMIFRGQMDKLYHPYVDIRMATGVSDNQSGSIKPSITDAEAIALWDALTSTIRVRPVSAAKTSEADPALEPLGTLAATGRLCPQTGLWRCIDEDRPVQGGRTRRLQAGDRMPHAVVVGEPSLWQRLKGDIPRYRVGTVWELVGYGDVVEGEPQGSALQAMNTSGAKDAAAPTDAGKMARTNDDDDADPGADAAGSEKAPPSGDPA